MDIGFLGLPNGYQGLGGADGSHSLQPDNYGSPDVVMNQVSLLDALQKQSSQTLQDISLMSPVSETLSLVTSGSIFEGA